MLAIAGGIILAVLMLFIVIPVALILIGLFIENFFVILLWAIGLILLVVLINNPEILIILPFALIMFLVVGFAYVISEMVEYGWEYTKYWLQAKCWPFPSEEVLINYARMQLKKSEIRKKREEKREEDFHKIQNSLENKIKLEQQKLHELFIMEAEQYFAKYNDICTVKILDYENYCDVQVGEELIGTVKFLQFHYAFLGASHKNRDFNNVKDLLRFVGKLIAKKIAITPSLLKKKKKI